MIKVILIVSLITQICSINSNIINYEQIIFSNLIISATSSMW